jgi:hypothetical protein
MERFVTTGDRDDGFSLKFLPYLSLESGQQWNRSLLLHSENEQGVRRRLCHYTPPDS